MTSSTSPLSPSAPTRSSAVAPGRRRRIDTMMPRPTTTSAAATTSTKNTAVWPSMLPSAHRQRDEAEVDGVEHQLDAHEDARAGCAARARRRRRCRTAPRRAPGTTSASGDDGRRSRRRHSVAFAPSSRRFVAARQQHGAGDGDDQQHRRELEGEDVVAEEVVGELRMLASWPATAPCEPATSRPLPDCERRRVTADDDGGDQQADDAEADRPPPAGAGSGTARSRRSSAWSTPSSMITNRNSTTIAPAYTITCTAARKWASMRHEVHGDAEQRQHEAERGVHRVAVRRSRRSRRRAPSPTRSRRRAAAC